MTPTQLKTLLEGARATAALSTTLKLDANEAIEVMELAEWSYKAKDKLEKINNLKFDQDKLMLTRRLSVAIMMASDALKEIP